MSNRSINPSKITKPMQLLAAWLTGLIVVNGSFLTAATHITSPSWAAGWLVVASVLNVPLFLIALFILQTRFRPEMQEDEYYARYLERRYSVNSAKDEYIEIDAPETVVEFSRGGISKKSLPAKVRKFAAGSSIQDIELNDLLPNYQKLRAALTERGFNIAATFGSSSIEPIAPSVFIIAFGKLEADCLAGLQKAITIAMDYGLEGIFHSPRDDGRIYVGAYSYEFYSYAAIEEKFLKRILNPTITYDEFRAVIMEHSTQPPKPGKVAEAAEKETKD